MRKVLFLVFFTLLTCSSLYAATEEKLPTEETLKKLEVFAKALNFIELNYVQSVDASKLIERAIDGMLRSLDPHTLYLPPQRFKRMRISTAGQYGGLGVEITSQEDGIVVVTPIENSPAFNAGIKPGDRILEINSQSTKGMNTEDASKLLEGKRGTKVKLLIQEKATGVTRMIELTRQVIKISSVKTQEMDGIAYIKINSFQERTAQTVRKQLEPLLKKSKPIRGVILDMRNNPGGLLSEAVQLADLFIDKGAIVNIQGRRKEYVETRFASSAATLTDIPTITLINGGTASAPEIVAGALKDHRKSIIMGTRSFGKGSVQTVIDLDDGSGLKLTVATYFTPKGSAIQAQGITPDIIVDPELPDVFHVISEAAVREEDLKGHLKTRQTKRMQPAPQHKLLHSDLQLMHAFDHIQAWILFSQSNLQKRATPVAKPKS